ncbi:hypothetical protein BpHYR1_010978 [Brachionus plicatilis]|uniref:Uncharacterized protein n=1 Tax=Brachionus plicatilis TaxID=10195 RepID=A0A3M7T1J9_BRAPC|nr:hypothetical protein BpHYR1_010978 [Brachionus plicatilis]
MKIKDLKVAVHIQLYISIFWTIFQKMKKLSRDLIKIYFNSVLKKLSYRAKLLYFFATTAYNTASLALVKQQSKFKWVIGRIFGVLLNQRYHVQYSG